MHNSEEISFQLPYIEHLNSLTFSWHSFSELGIDRVALSFAFKGCQYIVYV
jgi:hypothetical protein